MAAGNEGIDAAVVNILIERIRRETSEFEQHVEGEPFLPESDESAQTKFARYCLDIERVIGCDPASLGTARGKPIKSSLDHANWMFTPASGMFLDQRSADKVPHLAINHKFELKRFIEDMRLEVREPHRLVQFHRFLDHNKTGMSDDYLPIELPFLAILYASGKNPVDPSVYCRAEVGVFWQGNAENLAQLDAFDAAISNAADDAFFSIHYVALPNYEKVSKHGRPSKLAEVANRIATGSNLIQGAVGRRILESITLHFQRQWGDREAHLRKLASNEQKVKSNVAHDLSGHLQYAIELLDRAQREIEETGAMAQSVGHFVTAAEECVRAGFAAPWLLRFMAKEMPDTQVWDAPGKPSSAEIEILFENFERRLIGICNAERPFDSPAILTSERRIDSVALKSPLALNLEDPPSDWRSAKKFRTWPITRWSNESIISSEGRQALLFGPQSELLRNAVTAIKDTASICLDPAIHVVIDVASDGSHVRGSVRNKLPERHVLSDPMLAMPAKIEAMSIGLEAEIIASTGWFGVEWVLTFHGSRGHDGRGAGQAAQNLHRRR
ncbi:MAG TPA: hypothetical protein VIT45_00730 [Allosphingosinicella sp.]